MIARFFFPRTAFLLGIGLLFSMASVVPVAAQHFGRDRVQCERFDFQISPGW